MAARHAAQRGEPQWWEHGFVGNEVGRRDPDALARRVDRFDEKTASRFPCLSAGRPLANQPSTAVGGAFSWRGRCWSDAFRPGVRRHRRHISCGICCVAQYQSSVNTNWMLATASPHFDMRVAPRRKRRLRAQILDADVVSAGKRALAVDGNDFAVIAEVQLQPGDECRRLWCERMRVHAARAQRRDVTMR